MAVAQDAAAITASNEPLRIALKLQRIGERSTTPRGVMHGATPAATLGAGHHVIGEHGQKRHPGTDLVSVLLGHHPRDLSHVPQVMHNPGCQQLPERHPPQAGVLTRKIELPGREFPGAQQAQIRGTQAGEFGKQGLQRGACVPRAVAETIVGGEAEIGAWELVAGCTSLFLWWINLSAVAVGLLISPTRVVRAGRKAVGQRSLYRHPVAYAALLQMSAAELREGLGMPAHGQADHEPRLHRRAKTATEPPRSLPEPLRRVLRVLAGGINPIFGGVRQDSRGSYS